MIENIIMVIVTLGVSLFIIMGCFIISEWMMHLSHTKKKKKCGPASFDDFLKLFNKYEWKRDGCNAFSPIGSSYPHLTEISMIFYDIRFNNKYMYMKTPWDYFKLCNFINEYIKENQEKINWSRMD